MTRWRIVPVACAGVVGLLALAYLAVATGTLLERSTVGEPCVTQAKGYPTAAQLGAIAAMFLAAAVTVCLLAQRRRHRRLPLQSGVATGIVFASIAVVLGVSTFAGPWAGGWGNFAPPSRVLGLFLGSIDGIACLEPFPSGVYVALASAIAATGTSILIAASRAWRSSWDRLVAHLGSELDVIVGVDRGTPELVRALLDERTHDGSAKRRIVVLSSDPADGQQLVAQFPNISVLNIDPIADEEISTVILRQRMQGPPVIAIHRLFLLGGDQHRNVEIHDRVVGLIQRRGARTLQERVPRIIVRMRDAREARDWRLRVSSGDIEPTWFSDSVSQDGILAAEIADCVERERAAAVTLIGQTTLTIAVLDELAWRRWYRATLRDAQFRARRTITARDYPRRLVAELDVPELTEVIVVGQQHGVTDEWLASKPPFGNPDWQLPVEGVPVQSEFEQLRLDRREVFVVTNPAEDVSIVRAGARRANGQWLLLLPDPDASGVPARAPGQVALLYGPTWAPLGAVPEDTWSGIARLFHDLHRHTNGRHEATESRQTSAPWSRGPRPELPEFYRMDTLRQMRHVVQSFVALGYRWSLGQMSDVTIPEDDVAAVARSEHERWVALRQREGWSSGERDDSTKCNPYLRPWNDLNPDDRKANVEQIHALLSAFVDMGLSLEDIWTHERQGEVHATQLKRSRRWRSSTGSVLVAKPGDWWVTDGSSGRSVDSARFSILHQHTEGDRFLRKGRVVAREVIEEEIVQTLEGASSADHGHVVVSDGVSSWPVPRTHFLLAYVERAEPGLPS